MGKKDKNRKKEKTIKNRLQDFSMARMGRYDKTFASHSRIDG